MFLKQVDATHHQQPAIYIEPEGHGVKAATEQVRAEDFQHPGMIYRFAGRGAELPRNNRDPDVSYDLISIEDSLWAKRDRDRSHVVVLLRRLLRTARRADYADRQRIQWSHWWLCGQTTLGMGPSQ